MTLRVFTIGHSTHSADHVSGLLRRNGVTAIADVRSQPYSRMNPQFNREAFAAKLKGQGISYSFLGRELGARSEDPNCYVNGQVQYGRIAGTELFQAGLERIRLGAERYSIALMCAEKDPLTCHRTVLVARRLCERGFEVSHIREDGRIEPHEAALDRLLREVGLKADFFKSREELVNEAYALRERVIAYIEKPQAAAAS
jgi:uncharacterized protein (DUF488 family)